MISVTSASFLDTARQLLEVAATLAFALSGVIKAAHKRLDAVGVCVVAFLAAFGGGTLRDLLLDQRPFFWVRHVEFVWGTMGLSVRAMLFLRQRHFRITERAMLWPDMLGLGLFAAVGVDIAAEAGMPALICVMMGVITGVFGGVLRDLMCGEIPQAFRDHQPYAVCAFIGGWMDVGLRGWGLPEAMPMLACVLVTAGLRSLALWRGWRIPHWRVD
ncbi:trimeric intracellular cation channel family protein [Comamonas humi]